MKNIFRIIILLCLVLISQQSAACTTCNKPLQDAIFGADFIPNLIKLLIPFPVAMLFAGMVIRATGGAGVSNANTDEGGIPKNNRAHVGSTARPLVAAAIVLGIGMGGFVDGILFHQILQWHEMVSNVIPTTTVTGKNINMFWDGIFHAVTWTITLTGIIMLFRLTGRNDVIRSSRVFAGGLLTGWAIFNITEGIIDHYILKLHNVREAAPEPELYNHAFTALSIVMLIIGITLIRKGPKPANDPV